MDRLSRCATGIRASIWLSVSRVLATRPSSRTNAAMPSMVRLNSGTTNPPRPSAAKITSSPAVACASAAGEVASSSTVTSWYWLTCSATRVVVTGSATRPFRRSAAIRSSTTSSARSSLTIAALVVDQHDPLADRVEPDPEVGPGRGHQLGQPLQAGPGLGQRLGRGPLVQPVVDGQHVHADPAEQGGQHQRRGAARAVHHDLQSRRPATPVMSTHCSRSRA